MTKWMSYDLVWIDGLVSVREPSTWTESTVNSWRKYFTSPDSMSWFVFIDQPDLVVMRAGGDSEYARISINVPEKEEEVA